MARYKHIDTSPRFLAVDLQRQLLPGTFEHALNHLLDHALDLSGFDARFCNDVTDATAYPPAMLLKVILFAYSQGIISRRDIERACREHVIFIALSGDSQPHFTTLAGFVSSLGDDIARIFTQILFICDKQGLIGREMFAIDGVKLPSNASKAKSGNLKELAEMSVDALIADNAMRQRDERFDGQEKYKVAPDPLHDKSDKKASGKPNRIYRPKDFRYDPVTQTCICPAGKTLYGNGSGCEIGGVAAIRFQGAQRDCMPCEQRDRCLRTPEKTKARQVTFFQGRADGQESHTDKMRKRIDSPEGRARYGQRFATVEPVFGNLRHNKQLNRFTLRGRKKVDAQWKLYCLVHRRITGMPSSN